MKFESQSFLIVGCSCCREQRYLNFHKIRSVAEKFTAGLQGINKLKRLYRITISCIYHTASSSPPKRVSDVIKKTLKSFKPLYFLVLYTRIISLVCLCVCVSNSRPSPVYHLYVLMCILNIYTYIHVLYGLYGRTVYFEWFEISTFRKRAKEAWDNDDNIGGITPYFLPPTTTTIQSWCLHTRATGGDAAPPQFRCPRPTAPLISYFIKYDSISPLKAQSDPEWPPRHDNEFVKYTGDCVFKMKNKHFQKPIQ